MITDEKLSDMIENADGMRCIDGEYRIEGRDLMNLARSIAQRTKMTPTTPSPISDQAAGEQRVAFLEAELASATRMFHDACHDLGLINEALGLDPDDGGAEPILDAIAELKSTNSTAPTTGSAPDALGEMVGWCYEHGGRTRFVDRGDTYSDSIVFKMKPVYYAAPASPTASVLTDEQIDEVFEPFCGAITHTGGRKYEFARAIESRVIALLAASMGGEKA